MDETQEMEEGGPPRLNAARGLYGGLIGLAALLIALTLPRHVASHDLVWVGGLTALSVVGDLASRNLRKQAGYAFDMGVGLALVAVVTTGPLAAFFVIALPDLVYLGRQRRAFWNLGLIANVVSMVATAYLGSAVLHAAGHHAAALQALVLAATGLVMLAANYLFARLLLAVVRDRARVWALIEREFIAALVPECCAVGGGMLCALLMPSLGIPILAIFVLLVSLPQAVAARLLRAPSVAALTVDDAAAIYRDALADELALPRADRRLVHLVDSLVQRRPLAEAPPNPLAAMQDALLVTICRERPPTQRHFTATTRSQVILIARRWAELTARCTPALNHREALVELRRSGLAQDAPLALAAAARIIEREDALSEHVAGVPRLHRAPLPRTLRHDVLPVALQRLAA